MTTTRWLAVDVVLIVAALFLMLLCWVRPSGAAALSGTERCPCPAPDGTCYVPCQGCCDDKATPEIEQCPCDPTACGGR